MNSYGSLFKNNEASHAGGAIELLKAVGTFVDSTIDSNNGDTVFSDGGGLRIYNSAVTMTNSIVSNNEAGYGGGISMRSDSSSLILRQSTFSGNDASFIAPSGDDIYVTHSATLSIINTIIPTAANNIFVTSGNIPTWTSCADDPCSVQPHTGTCSAVDASDVKLGVMCLDVTATEETCGACNDTSIETKTICEASSTWTGAWAAGNWTSRTVLRLSLIHI